MISRRVFLLAFFTVAALLFVLFHSNRSSSSGPLFNFSNSTLKGFSSSLWGIGHANGTAHRTANPNDGKWRNHWTPTDGRFLYQDRLVSSNGRYLMNMTRNGEFRIYRTSDSKPLWWTNSALQWTGEFWGRVKSGGQFEALWRRESDPEVPVRDGDETTILFSSYSWPECQVEPREGMVPLIHLTDRGELQLLHMAEDELGMLESLDEETANLLDPPICTIFEGDPDALDKPEDMGRLAVVLTGTLRTFKQTCEAMNKKIFDAWPGAEGVDIFITTRNDDVYGYDLEPSLLHPKGSIPWPKVEADLRECFGERFKEISVNYQDPLPFDSSINPTCAHLSDDPNISQAHHYQVYYAHFLGYQMILNHMIKNHITYDYILKIRPDNIFWGDAIPAFTPQPADVVTFLPPYYDIPAWVGMHTNESRILGTDQAAWGSFSAMSTWLSVFPSFVEIAKADATYPQCYGPEVPCGDTSRLPCFSEGLAAYWLGLHKLRWKVDWRWKMAILRGDGSRSQTPHWNGRWNASQGDRYVETGWD